MNLILLLLSLVMIACILCNKLTSKIGIPMLLAFLAVGMLCGVDGILHIRFDNYAMTETLCTVALIFIIFYGGFGTKWSAAKPVAGKSVLLSTLGVFLTAFGVGVFCRFALHTSWMEGILMGAVLGSTDAASVFSILRSKKLNLKYGTASLLEVESGSNDPVAYLMTTILLAMMTSEITPGKMLYMIFAQIVYGVGIGAVLAVCTVFFLRRFRFEVSGFDTVFMAAVAILSYVLPVLVGGNGYLSAYIAGIILGNAKIPNKKKPGVVFRRRDQLYAADGVFPAGTALYTVPAGQCDPAGACHRCGADFRSASAGGGAAAHTVPFKAFPAAAGLLGRTAWRNFGNRCADRSRQRGSAAIRPVSPGILRGAVFHCTPGNTSAAGLPKAAHDRRVSGRSENIQRLYRKERTSTAASAAGAGKQLDRHSARSSCFPAPAADAAVEVLSFLYSR